MRNFHFPGRSSVLASNGMCATSHPLAAKVAVNTLERGGNAMDAAIAGAVILGLCEPQMTGIGGDCFVLFNAPGTNDVQCYNGSGHAPHAINAEAMREAGHNTVPENGAEAVTVPGAIDAFCHLSETHGKLGIDALLAPSIRYAEEGIPVAPRVAYDWPFDAECLSGHGITHFSKGGAPLAEGDMFRAPGQADVLRGVAKNGRDAFYTGDVAEDMLAALNAVGGVHTAEDFASTSGIETSPLAGTYKGLELLEHPPNGQGAAAILLLNILKNFDLASMDPMGAARAHIEAEATKLAYDARNRIIGDPDHSARVEFMLSQHTADKLAAVIDPKRAMADAAPLTEAFHKDTINIIVVDKDRMAVSMIYSIFHGFGSGIASEKFGILLHNRGAAFNLTPGHPNEIGPGKRPMHTIIPGLLRREGRVMLPFGVMGGQYQSTGHARFVTNLEDFGMTPQAAIDAPRSFAEKGELQIEEGYSEAVRTALAEMGHNVVLRERPLGGAQAIMIREDGVLEGGSDPRKDGCALGY
ncbi:MAG: gamma-glutamyltransferase family protein [Pseudomonadota bacterium]